MTIPEFVFKNTALYLDRPALAVKHHGIYKSISFQELKIKAFQFMKGLANLNIKPQDKIAIFSENRPEWVIADLGIQLAGAVSVPIHSVFQPKYIKHVLEDSSAKILIVSDNHLFEKLHQTHGDLKLEKIIYLSRNRLFGINPNKFIYFTDLIKQTPVACSGQATKSFSKDSPATIVYTSGTTGLPKGVVLSHQNLISNIQATVAAVPVGPADRLLSFLPLSHIFERTAGYYAPLSQGAAIFYAEDYKKLAQDLRLAKPTILIGVPRIFEKAYEKIVAKKSFRAVWKIPGGRFWLEKIIKKRFGGRIKFCISGGAALDAQIARFFQKFNLLILEGYGLTETSPVITCNRLDRYKFGSCGLPLNNLNIKKAPDGELLVKGPSVMKEYHNLPVKTKEIFTTDGYFKTGDLVEIDPEGFVQIVGRKKNIIVLSTGKKVQPEEIETALDASAHIEQVMVIGEGKKMVTALIVPEWDMFKSEEGWSALTSEAQERQAYAIISHELERLLADFPEHEQIKKFTLLTHPFSLEKDELSPTLKLKRKVIEKRYAPEIKTMYK